MKRIEVAILAENRDALAEFQFVESCADITIAVMRAAEDLFASIRWRIAAASFDSRPSEQLLGNLLEEI
jgi:hypothetical protein